MNATEELSFSHRRFTADELDRMVAAGVVGEDEPLELLNGELVAVRPQGPNHIRPLSRLVGRLARAYGAAYEVQPQGPIDCGADSRPEPDVAVAAPDPGRPGDRLVRGDELVLAIEVAHTSQALDHAKAAIYARAGVPEYWILDIAARRLEVQRQPTAGGIYEVVTILAETQSITAPSLDTPWLISDLLP